MFTITEQEALEAGFAVCDFVGGEFVFLKNQTNFPYWKYQDKSLIYYFDDILTGDRCDSEVITVCEGGCVEQAP